MKIHVIGDIHGNVLAYWDVVRDMGEDHTVQVGDFGDAKAYERAENVVDGLGDRHFFFGGNHDEYPQLPDWHLGDYGALPFYDNGFFVRGADSIDKDYRTPGRDWWPEEQINQFRHGEVLEAYTDAEPDLVLSHAGPDVAVRTMFPDAELYDTATTHLLNRMWSTHRPRAWVFGHWHESRLHEAGDTLFVCLGELEAATIRV